MSTNKNIYHEHQVRQLCALHTLNNLFQGRFVYTKEQLDEICIALNPNNWFNPHRSMLGWGNYDINVIMRALQMNECEACWFDKRKDPSCINLNAVEGFILNIPSDYKLGFVTIPLQRRHWIAVCKVDGSYYNLDSKLKSPICIGGSEELLEFLRSQLSASDREIFIVVHNNNDSHCEWLNSTE